MRTLSISLIVAAFAASALGQGFDRDAKELVLNRSHVVTLKVEKKVAVITMESISDFTDSDNDYTSLRVDVNDNKTIDEGVDIGFGLANGSRAYCPFFLIREGVTTPCGRLSSAGSARKTFARSAYADTPHPIFVYRIPVRELTESGNTVGFLFTFYNGGSPTFYPANRPNRYSFSDTISHTF